MDSGIVVAALIGIALIAANLPFFTRRIFFVFEPGGRDKRFAWRLAEAIVLYLLVGGLARALEARQGAVYPQNWEFYAITFCLFLVLGYPGFVYRYLWRRR